MMNKEERRKELDKKFNCANDYLVLKLYEDWCTETNNGETPLTPMREWENYCTKYDVPALQIEEFQHWHSYFFTVNGKIFSVDDLEALSYWDCFSECINYYAETVERYNRAMAILNGDKYIVNANNHNICI